MARGKNRNRLFGRRSRSSNTAEARTTRSVGGLPFLRFPPDSKKPSKTTKSKTTRGGLFGRTKKDRVKPTLPTKGAPIGDSKSTIGIAISTENWKYRSNDDKLLDLITKVLMVSFTLVVDQNVGVCLEEENQELKKYIN